MGCSSCEANTYVLNDGSRRVFSASSFSLELSRLSETIFKLRLLAMAICTAWSAVNTSAEEEGSGPAASSEAQQAEKHRAIKSRVKVPWTGASQLGDRPQGSALP